ncbi:MAG: DUF5397 family protein [Gallionella sp.]|nr:DUF5397 family protein [Gallionella sp.]
MSLALIEPPVLAQGKIKSFGVFGPKYEVGNLLRQLADGDWMVRIKLLESGEETEYCYSHLINDPEAR